MKKTAICVLAHPDDAEILCTGTFARLAELGWNIHICTMTPGDVGSLTHDRWQISAIRTAEARNAASLIGATYHCLDEDDVFISYDRKTVSKVIDLFRSVSPSLVITHAPRDYMVDHEMTSLAARSASFGYSTPNVSTVPLAPGSHVPHLYYCDPIEGIDPFGHPVTPTTLINVTDKMELKTRMLTTHASQREWLRAHHGMDEYVDAMHRFAAARGRLLGVPFAEAFVQHRGHGYPHNDLLLELLK